MCPGLRDRPGAAGGRDDQLPVRSSDEALGYGTGQYPLAIIESPQLISETS